MSVDPQLRRILQFINVNGSIDISDFDELEDVAPGLGRAVEAGYVSVSPGGDLAAHTSYSLSRKGRVVMGVETTFDRIIVSIIARIRPEWISS